MSNFLNFKADRESSYMERRKGKGYEREKKIVTILKEFWNLYPCIWQKNIFFSKKENSYHHIWYLKHYYSVYKQVYSIIIKEICVSSFPDLKIKLLAISLFLC